MSANGYLPLSSLTQVDGWAYLETNTAHAWVNAAAETLAITGIRPIITSPIGAYRSYAQQVQIKAEYNAAGKGYQAAYPGTSNHGLGTAVDVNNIGHFNQAQLDTIMARHGFVRDVTFESWHYHHTSINPADNTSTAAVSSTPLTEISTPTPLKKDEDMKLIRLAVTNDGKPNGQIALAGETTFKQISKYTADGFATVLGPIVDVTEDTWTFWNQTAAATGAARTSK